MSFVKKGLNKIKNFVKKHWKKIVVVAAVAFTAGIVTVGMPAFTSMVGSQGIFSAVGSTMWAGVTATAGSMGIGSGASGSIAAAAGATGKGLGAAIGWGGGYGLGAAGKTAAAKAAGSFVNPAPLMSNVGTAGKGLATNPLTGEAIGEGSAALLKGAGAGATESGMTLGKAMMYGKAMEVGGAMLTGLAQGKALEEQLEASKPLAAWGVPTGDRGGRTGPVEDYLFEGAEMPQYAPPTPQASDVGDPTQAANQLAMNQANRPLQSSMGGALMNQPGQPAPMPASIPMPTASPQHLAFNIPEQRPGPTPLMRPIDDWRTRAGGFV